MTIKTTDISVIGPVDGMNEHHPEGSYFRVVLISKRGLRQEHLISRVALEMLKAELDVLLQSFIPYEL